MKRNLNRMGQTASIGIHVLKDRRKKDKRCIPGMRVSCINENTNWTPRRNQLSAWCGQVVRPPCEVLQNHSMTSHNNLSNPSVVYSTIYHLRESVCWNRKLNSMRNMTQTPMFSFNCDGSILHLMDSLNGNSNTGVTFSVSLNLDFPNKEINFEMDCSTVSFGAGWTVLIASWIERLLCVCSPTWDVKHSEQNQHVGYFQGQ